MEHWNQFGISLEYFGTLEITVLTNKITGISVTQMEYRNLPTLAKTTTGHFACEQ